MRLQDMEYAMSDVTGIICQVDFTKVRTEKLDCQVMGIACIR